MRKGILKAIALMMVVMLTLSMTALAVDTPSGSFTLPKVNLRTANETGDSEDPDENPDGDSNDDPNEDPDENPDEDSDEDPDNDPDTDPNEDPDESKYICGLEEHTHSDECLGEDGSIVCGLEEHTHGEECLTEEDPEEPEENEPDVTGLIDLLAYLVDNGFNPFISFTNANGSEIPTNEKGQFVVEADQEYVFSVKASDITILPGKYYIRFPAGLDGISRSGNLGLECGGAWTYDKETGLLVFEFTDEDWEVDLSATFTITFFEASSGMKFGDISVEVKLPEVKTEPTLKKAAYNSISSVPPQIMALFDPQPTDNYRDIVWSVEMRGDDDETLENPFQFIGGSVTDNLVGNTQHFSEDDISRGVVMQVTIPEMGTHLTTIYPTYTNNSWTFTMPEEITIDGDAVKLLNSYQYKLYFTSTVNEPIDSDKGEPVSYSNEISADGKHDSSSSGRQGAHYVPTGITKSSSFSWGTDPKISWTIKASIPSWDTAEAPTSNWWIEDNIQLVANTSDTPNQAIYNKLANPDNVTVTQNNTTVPHISKANGTSTFAWDVKGTGLDGKAGLYLYHKCAGEGHDNANHSTTNGYCTAWTETDVVTFYIRYEYDATDIEELIYGASKDIGEQIAEGLLKSIRNDVILHWGGDGSDSDSTAGKSHSSVSFLPPLDKTLNTGNLDEDIAEYTITINQGHRQFTSADNKLHIVDTMCEGIALLQGSLVVKKDSTVLTENVGYTFSTNDAGNEITIDIPTTVGDNAKYTIQYSAYIVRDEKGQPINTTLSNDVEVELFGVKLLKEISRDAGYAISANSKNYLLTVTKQNANTGEKLEDVTFGFGDLDHQDVPLWTYTTNENGTVLIQKDVKAGRLMAQHQAYYIKEMASLKGYAEANEPHWFVYCRNSADTCASCNAVIAQIHEAVGSVNVQRFNKLDKYENVDAYITVENQPYDTYAPSVEKVIAGDPVTEDEFEFILEIADNPNGGAKLTGLTTVTVTGEDSASFGDIEFTRKGTYVFTIKETAGDLHYYNYDETPWTLTVVIDEYDNGGIYVKNAAYTNGASSSDATATFTNIYDPTPVSMAPAGTKEITNAEAIHAGAEKPFSFLVSLIDEPEGGTSSKPLAGAVTGAGEITFEEITFALAGTYTFEIQEVRGNAYGYQYDGESWKMEVAVVDLGGVLGIGSVVYSKADTTVDSATFNNIYTYGNLTVRKTVTGEGGDTARYFTFTVTLNDNTINGTYGDMTFNGGTARFRLRHGQSATARDLPSGVSYTVTESDNDGYTVTRTGNTGVIAANATRTAAFTNDWIPTEPTPEPTATPEPTLVSISGSKTWVDDDNAGETRPASIVVRLQQNGSTIDQQTVTAANNWRYTFNNLPEADENAEPYVYTVSEQMVGGYYARVNGYDLTNTFVPDAPIGYRSRMGSSFAIANLSVGELEELISLFDYDTPLWGGLLGTGDDMPVYPFVFMGIGAAALLALLAMSRRKRKTAK